MNNRIIRKIILSIILILVTIFVYSIDTQADTIYRVRVIGASARMDDSDGTQALRFEAKLENLGNLKKTCTYGIAIAWGVVEDASEIQVGCEVNGKNVLSSTIEELEDGESFFGVVFSFPTTYFLQDISAVGFYYDYDLDDFIYDDVVVTRNLSEVVLKSMNDGYNGNLFPDVIEVIKDKKRVISDSIGNIYSSDILWETNSSLLEKEFIKDYNNMYPNDTQITSQNLETFFSHNQKWDWLLDLLSNYEISLEDNGFNETLNAFFNQSQTNTYDFSKGELRNIYGDIWKYNTYVYSDLSFSHNAQFVEVNEIVKLETTLELNQESISYVYNDVTYNYGATITIPKENIFILCNAK